MLDYSNMADKADNQQNNKNLRIYEVGYHLIPITSEEEVSAIHSGFKDLVEKSGGVIIEDGIPTKKELEYSISIKLEGDRNDFSTSYFGWIKFEGSVELADKIEEAISAGKSVLRHILVKTIREKTYVPREDRVEAVSEFEEEDEAGEEEKASSEPASKEEKKELTEDDKKAIDESIEEMVSE